MTVRELIVELLDCDMGATVDFDIKTNEEDINESNFDLSRDRRYVTFVLEPKDYVLIDSGDYEEMKDRLYELENK